MAGRRPSRTDLITVPGSRVRTRTKRVVLTAACPECGAIHRHDLGPTEDPEVAAVVRQGYAEVWMPCRGSLPGNFYRVRFPPNEPTPSGRRRGSRSRRRSSEAGARPASSDRVPEEPREPDTGNQ